MGCVHDGIRILCWIKYNLRSVWPPFSPAFQRDDCYLCRSDNVRLRGNFGYHLGQAPPPEEFQPAVNKAQVPINAEIGEVKNPRKAESGLVRFPDYTSK
jgi:hypothetical protein